MIDHDHLHAFVNLRDISAFICLLLSVNLSACHHGDPRGIDEQEMILTEDDFGTTEEVNLNPHLRLNHLQALGTHNSYHLKPSIMIRPWDYEHLALDLQLDQQGVRQVELDLHEVEGGGFEVFHLPMIDAESSCSPLKSCLELMKQWSDQHLGHHPVLVLLEIKRTLSSPEEVIAQLEESLNQIWGSERLVTPGLVMGEDPTLREALDRQGWPSIDRLRARFLFVLHSGGELREALLEGGLRTRLMFPDAFGDLNADFAAYHSINDPIGSEAEIRAAVEAGHLVRTRADVDSEQTVTLDRSRGEKALLIGAHWISTDYPIASGPEGYGFLIPEGTPSRCNPISAPSECTSQMIEDLMPLSHQDSD